MRRIRYQVACSVDGYIAGPNGEYDWIVMDPEIDFGAIFAQFGTLLMGRRTFESSGAAFPGMNVLVFSRTLQAAAYPNVRIVSENPRQAIDTLRAQPGKDIWLFGGGELFQSLLALGCVDTVELAVIPVLLGGGRPFLPAPAARQSLILTGQRVYQTSGTVLLSYDVVRSAPKRPTRTRKPRAT